MDILRHGRIESDEQFVDFALEFSEVIIPSDEDEVLTHFWVIRIDGTEKLYAGTLDTFAAYVGEVSGIQ